MDKESVDESTPSFDDKQPEGETVGSPHRTSSTRGRSEQLPSPLLSQIGRVKSKEECPFFDHESTRDDGTTICHCKPIEAMIVQVPCEDVSSALVVSEQQSKWRPAKSLELCGAPL